METGNKIGKEGAKALSEMLKVNTRLDELYVNSVRKRLITLNQCNQGKTFPCFYANRKPVWT